MADTVEKINIIDLEINQDQALEDLTDIQREIIETKDATNLLLKANKELTAQGKQNGEQYQKNAKQVEVNKLQLKGLTKEYSVQQKVVNDVLNTTTRELGTLEKLTLQNKELRQELRELNLETEEGQKRRREINDQIEDNTDTIKENSDSFVQSKINVGNYQESIENAIPALRGMTGGIQQVTRAGKAFIASPIGLILAAIAVSIGLLVKGFKQSQFLADKMKTSVSGLSASFNVLIDRVSNGMEGAFKKLRGEPVQAVKDLGKAIVTNLINRAKAVPEFFVKAFEVVKNVFKRDGDAIKQSLKELNQEFIQFTTGLDNEQQKKFADNVRTISAEMKEESKAAKELTAAEFALLDLEIEMTTQLALLTKQREEAKLATRDETLSMRERLEAQDEAIALDKEVMKIEVDLAKERARISQARIDLGKSTREELKANAELQAEVTRVESAFFTRSKELFSERIGLSNQLKAAEKARTDATKAALLEEAQDLQKFVENEVELWKLRNQSITDGVDVLNDDLVNAEIDRLAQEEELRIAAVEQSFDATLISEQEKQLQILTIQRETNAEKLKIEEEFQGQMDDLEEKRAAQQFTLEQMALETRLGAEFDVRRNDLNQWHTEQVELAKGNQDILLQLDITYAALRKQIKQAELSAQLSSTKELFGNLQSVVAEHTVAYKAASTAIIAIDTYKSAIAAFGAMAGIPYVGPILGGIAAAAATASGIAAIRNVWAVDETGGARSISAPSGGGGATATIPAASINQTGGLVERNLDQQATGRQSQEVQVPVLITDQVSADQTNLAEIEALSSV